MSTGMRKRKILSYLYVAALSFNLVWFFGSLQQGLFDEQSFLPQNSLRHLAYPYYGPSHRESRFVGIALHELYDAPTLITSSDVLAYLFEVEDLRYHAREVSIELIDNPRALLPAVPDGAVETYLIGLEEKEVVFVLPDENSARTGAVVAIREGDRVVFVPISMMEE
jgi:hypothetical protein